MVEKYIPKLNHEQHIGVFADTGYGKTQLLNYFIRKFSKTGKVIVYNTDFETKEKDFNERVVYFDPPPSKADDLNYLNAWIRKCRSLGSNYLIVIRDLDRFFDNTTSSNKSAKELKDLISTGRHQNICFMYECKQPSFIPSKIIAGSHVIFLGNFTTLSDTVKLKNYASVKELTSVTKPIFIMNDRRVNRRFLVKLNIETQKLELIGELPSLIK